MHVLFTGGWRVEDFTLEERLPHVLLFLLGLNFWLDLESLDVRQIADLATLLFEDGLLFQGLVLVDHLHELADLGVRLHEVHMLVTEDFLDNQFGLFSGLNDLVAVVLLVLMLVEVALDNTVSQLVQLLESVEDESAAGVLEELGLRDLVRDVVVEATLGHVAQLPLKLRDLVPAHFLWRLQVQLRCVFGQISACRHVNTGHVSVFPVLGLASAWLRVHSSNCGHRDTRVLHLLLHE